MDCMCQICTCVPSALVTPDINTERSAEKRFHYASQIEVQIPWKYKTQHHHLDVYQRSLSAIHLHAAVHNCGRGQSNWRLRSCLKYFVFCRSLWLWLFFFCLVDRCLVVVWCYCCVPFSEEEKTIHALLSSRILHFSPYAGSCGFVRPPRAVMQPSLSPRGSPEHPFSHWISGGTRKTDFRAKNASDFRLRALTAQFPERPRSEHRVINTCHSSEAVIMLLLLLLFFLFVCFFCCHSRWIQHLFRS